MRSEDLTTLFDQQAPTYDAQWLNIAPVRDGLLFLLGSVFAELPANAHVLCVGVGTGEEIAHLAKTFPDWRFTAVEPSGAMLQRCREKALAQGFASRCHFHEGYLDTLPDTGRFDGATCFLVSQFILEPAARTAFFRGMAERLKPGATLASADLSADVDSPAFEAVLRAWLNLMAPGSATPRRLERTRAAFAQDVAILPPNRVAAIIEAAGFEAPVLFYQAVLIHAWFAQTLKKSDPH